jgi:hypothetical protein
MESPVFQLHLRPDHPAFDDLPWHLPLGQWQGASSRLEDLPRGLSRHPVVFVNYDGSLYALKELPSYAAEHEYDMLCRLEEMRLPVVTPVGFGYTSTTMGDTGVLITRYLDRSLPYRSLFMRSSLQRYREHLLDAIAGLLVQLHLAGVFWGDCSLSNTLFCRDAGALQAFLVDAETVELFPDRIPAAMRYHDLEIMDDGVNGDLNELETTNQLTPGVPILDTGAYIRQRYRALWDEITREDIINPGEHYRIQERIRTLNQMGFSVGEVELAETDGGNQLQLRVAVTDRNFHRDQLHGLTGLDVGEMQARALMNEIQELKGTQCQAQNRNIPLSVAAYHWLQNVYLPTLERLKPLVDAETDPPELYYQLLEHKWYLSEQRQHDVGHVTAAEDFLTSYREA